MISTAIKFIRHWFLAKGVAKIPDQEIREMMAKVFAAPKSQVGNQIEDFRKSLLKSEEVIEIKDLGAGYGGKMVPNRRRKMREIVKSSARGRREGEFLFHFARNLAPDQVLELGTNLGFSTLYLGKALPDSKVVSIEGAPALADKARSHFKQFDLSPEQKTGDFMHVMETDLDWSTFQPDLIFIDGNHRREPTIEYVQYLLPKLNAGGVMILDDIHWSGEMSSAWKEIKNLNGIGLCLDLFFMGICFTGNKGDNQEIKLRFMP